MSQIINITSEALQKTIRRLLPSQQGFGEDLQASNVILPIVDLTPTAEGSAVPSYLQRSLSLDSQTAHNVSGATSTLINTTGFHEIIGVTSVNDAGAGTENVSFSLTDGLSTKLVWRINTLVGGSTNNFTTEPVSLVIFLNAGESITCTATTNALFVGSSRQVADINGNLVNPAGFQPQ